MRRRQKHDVGELIEMVRLTQEGRDLLEAIEIECGYGQSVFHPDSERQTNFNLGKQQVAIWLRHQHQKYQQNKRAEQ